MNNAHTETVQILLAKLEKMEQAMRDGNTQAFERLKSETLEFLSAHYTAHPYQKLVQELDINWGKDRITRLKD